MRKGFYQYFARILFLLMFLTSTSLTADVAIKTTTQNDETLYWLQAGAFSQQKNAEELQKKLSALLRTPIRIEKQESLKLYLVQIGPIKDYAKAREVKKQVEAALDASTPPNNVEKKSSETVWNLRNADIRAVIAEVSRVTGKNFLIDPRVQGKISIISSTPMNEKELYQVFLSMLHVSGYSAVPSGDVIKIIPNIEAKTTAPDLLSRMKHPPRGDDMMVQVIPVKYVPAEQLVPVLRPLMPQWSSVSAYAPSNMLILSGRANKIRQLANIIKQVDSSSSQGIDVVPLKHALAMDVATTLKDLVKPQQPGNMRNQTILSADDRNNSILISGSKTERIRLRLLIHQLDKPSPYGSDSNTQVVYLNYARAEDLAPVLAGIAQASFSGTVGFTIGTVTTPVLDSTNPAASMGANATNILASSPPTPPSPPTASGAAPNTISSATIVEGSTKPSVQIIAEPNTNSIIINAPLTIIRMLKSVISQLDIKPAQILIEALVAEINESDILNLGIEWGSVVKNADGTTTFRPGFAILDSNTSLDDFQARIFALAQERRANVLSTPSVMVLDNRQAKILIGKQLSVATTSYPNNAGGTTTASPFTTFDRVNVALHLYVRPQITRGDGIQMQIDQGNDTIDPINSVNLSTNPVFNISAIVTSVHVESGNIIVLGGLIQDSAASDDNRLPILGDIPGVGKLFQHNLNSREKKVLMVFIRPFILRTNRDSLNVTGEKYRDVRREQLEIMREMDYNEHLMDSVLPPLRNAELPKPFCPPAIIKKKVTPPKPFAATK